MLDACQLLKNTGKGKKPAKGSTGSKPANTIDILDQNVYEALKLEAEKIPESLRKYVNDQLEMGVEKQRFMRRYMPKLKKIAFDRGLLFIDDREDDKTAQVGLSKDGLVHCRLCDSDTCVHVMYALAMPELGRLEPM